MREFMIVARSRMACLLFGHKDRVPGRCYRIACVGRIREGGSA